MADVQKENGYTAIANELLEAICNSGFTAMELKVILTVARFTYGYNQKDNKISLGFIAKFIKCKGRSHVSEAVTHLIRANIIHSVGVDSQTRILKINKDYETWNTECSENGNSFQNGNSCQKGNSKHEDFEEVFEKLWAMYPRKRGKNKVTKKAKKELEKAGFETVARAISNYKSEIKKNRTNEKYIMYGSTFFNGGWRDFEREVTPDAGNEPKFKPSTGFRNWEQE